ncbi:superfamily I DNA and/or RNA helicase [Streptomyces sp. PvR018]
MSKKSNTSKRYTAVFKRDAVTSPSASHRDQADLVRAALARTGNPVARGVAVDTANRLQGRESEVVIVVHPLSGSRDATAFHLEAGRLCVLASRHR